MSELEITLAIIAVQAIGNVWAGVELIRSALLHRQRERYVEHLENQLGICSLEDYA